MCERTNPLLESLRWREDIVVTNHEGQRVWLKPCLGDRGERIGITDCCAAAEPCDYHAAIACTIVDVDPVSDFGQRRSQP